jgi:hypothetical protein
MIRNCFLFGSFIMVFSLVAGARDQQFSPRQRMLMHLRQGNVELAMAAAHQHLRNNRESRTQASGMNDILREHAQDLARMDEFFPVPVMTRIRELCLLHVTNDVEDLVAMHNLGYVLLRGIGVAGSPTSGDVARGIDLIRRSKAQGLFERFLLIDPSVFDQKEPNWKELALTLFEKVDWEKHPLLQAWIATHLGFPPQATMKHPTKGFVCLEGSTFKRL